jgi:glutaredoxin
MPRPARILIALGFLSLCAGAGAAGLYRWVDERGQVHYSDQPPPAGAKQSQQIKRRPPASADAEGGRAKVQVTLYSAACGPTCDQAAEYVGKRGVPYTLKSVDKDPAAAADLKKRTGDLGVPVLVVGESMQRGYSPSVWDKMLEMGGYPAAKPDAAAGQKAEATAEPPPEGGSKNGGGAE